MSTTSNSGAELNDEAPMVSLKRIGPPPGTKERGSNVTSPEPTEPAKCGVKRSLSVTRCRL